MMWSNLFGSVSDVTTTLEINGGSFDMIPFAVAAPTGQRDCSSSMWKPSASAPASITPFASSNERMPQTLTRMRYSTSTPSCESLIRILCCQIGRDILISEDGRKGENIYGVPGGHLEAGETLRDCVLLEVKEEAGIVCRELNRVSVHLR